MRPTSKIGITHRVTDQVVRDCQTSWTYDQFRNEYEVHMWRHLNDWEQDTADENARLRDRIAELEETIASLMGDILSD